MVWQPQGREGQVEALLATTFTARLAGVHQLAASQSASGM